MQALRHWVSSRPVSGRVRLSIGGLILIGGLAAALAFAGGLLGDLARLRPGAFEGIRASALAGAATGLGALGLLLFGRLDARRLVGFIALGGGMMLAAALFSLILPALSQSTLPGAADVVVATAVGWFAMRGLDRALPHLHASPISGRPLPDQALRLMVVAIAAHNLPEGFAVGAGFGGGAAFGWTTAAAIGLQNVPEGLVVATALWSLGTSRLAAVAGALATGLLEPFGAIAGVLMVDASAVALPIALGLAGGAMLFVVVDELLPEAVRRGNPPAVVGLAAVGFAAVVGLAGAF